LKQSKSLGHVFEEVGMPSGRGRKVGGVSSAVALGITGIVVSGVPGSEEST